MSQASRNLKDKVLFITGASRGIGLAIALRAARDGARVAIAAKTVVEHAKLPGTIFSAAEEIKAAGGQALALECDIRNEEAVKDAIAKCVSEYGALDILINNASAISLTPTEQTEMKRYDLMHQVNARGTFMCSKYAIEHLSKASNPHILTLSPPLNMNSRWFAPHCAYTMAKYGMSMCTLGMSAELKAKGIAVNSLWPETAVATAAVQNLLGGDQAMRACRTPDVVADAAHWILTQPAKDCSGNFFIDSEVLTQAGVKDLDTYAVTPGGKLLRDFFLD
jgi:citronellol/citronellal dehydrogenase